MSETTEVKVPDIGDFDEVPVIEIHVSEGDEVAKEDPLVTLESDKATMDVPSPAAGKVTEVLVAIDDKVSEGSPLLKLEEGEGDGGADAEEKPEGEVEEKDDSDDSDDGDDDGDASSDEGSEASGEEPSEDPDEPGREAEDSAGSGSDELPDADKQCDVLVIGSGPGGYAAAFRAADLGLDVILVERYATIGGVCLNVGCIPSKALLHAAKVIGEASDASDFGLTFPDPEIDLDRLRSWKDDVVGKLTGGLTQLAKRRKVEIVKGVAAFKTDRIVEVDSTSIAFRNCIIAAGSRAATLPGFPEDDPRVVGSTGALELPEIPEKMLVVGGGIIGLEMATVYGALGSEITVVEMTDQLIPGCDTDLVKPLGRRLESLGANILLKTKVAEVEAGDDGLEVSFEGDDAPDAETFDYVLVAVGRQANGDRLELGESGVEVGERGQIAVDPARRTNVSHIYAIGDITGEPMLAHKATHEGKVAAEVIAGENVVFEPRAIPSVAYTDPEVAWAGLTETQAKEDGTEYEKASFPWQASGRALSLDRPEGMTKLLLEPESNRILGVGIVGPNAGDLISEAVLAIEMGADAEDVALTIHPHPTLSETVAFSAEVAEGTVTDLYAPKRDKKK